LTSAAPQGEVPAVFTYPYPRPAVTVDSVVFSLRAEELIVLLIRRKNEPFAGHWALPGGFVDAGETLGAANLRELKEETGLTRAKFEMLGAYGDPGRDPRGHTVSVAYLTFIPSEKMLRPGDDAAELAWFPLSQVFAKKTKTKTAPKRAKGKGPGSEAIELAFDHAKIIRDGFQRMALHLSHPTLPRPFSFVPDLFTVEQIGRVYEAVLGPMMGRHVFEETVVRGDWLEPVVASPKRTKSKVSAKAGAKTGVKAGAKKAASKAPSKLHEQSELYRWRSPRKAPSKSL
jgi:8-oxo-dGTP diphosphatase